MKIDVTKILDDLGITHVAAGQDNVAVRCLNPNHNDTRPSMNIHIHNGAYHCMSCGFKGHILQLVKNKFEFNQIELIKYVQQFQLGGTTEEEITQSLVQFFHDRKTGGKKEFPVVTNIPEHDLIQEHPYLMQRGFTSQELLFWKMGSCIKYPYTNWVYIPIYYKEVLRNYFLRSNTERTKLYGPYPRKDILFGFDSANDFTKPVYICEGIFDMIFLRRLKVQAVAILANHILDEQLAVLKKYREINIVPDIDKNLRGMQAVHDIFTLLHSTNIFVLELPNGKKDPAECTLQELVTADYYKTPILNYVMQERYQRFLKTIPQKKRA